MKKVVIIDDEPLARAIIREYIRDKGADVTVVAECDDGFEGVKAVLLHKPDLIFLDVQMPRISGFEMLEVLEHVPDVIFATAFDEYAIRAFERNAVDYLLKPFSKERFDQAFEKWKQRTGKPSAQPNSNILPKLSDEPGVQVANRIVVRNNNQISIIPATDVVYIEAFDDYVKIFTNTTFHLKKKTMSFYERTLDPAVFFRAHRSFIINLNFLTRIETMEKNSYVALLKSGKRIPLSRSAYSDLKIRLGL